MLGLHAPIGTLGKEANSIQKKFSKKTNTVAPCKTGVFCSYLEYFNSKNKHKIPVFIDIFEDMHTDSYICNNALGM